MIEWTDKTRPEDIMDGKDLEAYYATARNYMHKDTSSSEEEQTNHLQELSKLLKINFSDVPGYKTFFQDKNSFDSGIPGNLQAMYDYFDTLIDSHPELIKDFDLWSKQLDVIAQKNIKDMSEKEFRKLAACPASILSAVDPEHRHLFTLQKSDFLKVSSPPVHSSSPSTSAKSQKEGAESAPAPKKMNSYNNNNNSSSSNNNKAEPSTSPQMTHLQKRIAEVFDIMFDSMWKSNAPVTISYVSNGTKLHDIFLYLKFADGLDLKAKQEICKQLESKKHLFVDMLKITLHIQVRIVFCFHRRRNRTLSFAIQSSHSCCLFGTKVEEVWSFWREVKIDFQNGGIGRVI